MLVERHPIGVISTTWHNVNMYEDDNIRIVFKSLGGLIALHYLPTYSLCLILFPGGMSRTGRLSSRCFVVSLMMRRKRQRVEKRKSFPINKVLAESLGITEP